MTGAIVELGAADTSPLRRTVLRDGTLSDVVEFDGDDLTTTFHLGVRLDGEVVAISSWMRRPFDAEPDRDAFQVRGMATDPAHRGRGFGHRLLVAGIERCRERGATLVWARARDTALGFYERRGFTTVGPGYIDTTTGLPHHDVVRPLDRGFPFQGARSPH
jgi:GNAT superfamily N-acetyltransferase